MNGKWRRVACYHLIWKANIPHHIYIRERSEITKGAFLGELDRWFASFDSGKDLYRV